VDYRTTLRRLAIRDDSLLRAVSSDECENRRLSGLDARTCALVRLAALIADDAASVSYMHAIDSAREAGITPDDIVGTLIAVIPAAGGERSVAAAPKLGLALGYDVETALERPDADATAGGS
jgi:alkylhydroperoxidase/carboxymuconolactone decarboxylase family protein YurZ